MVILGIDPGLANTGWGVIETRGSQCRARAYGCVHTDKDLTLPMRLKRIHDEIAEVIMRYSPMEVAVEEIFFCSNAQSAIATAQARGAALVACTGCGLEVGEYTPMQIKQAVVGYGLADKHQVMDMTRRLLKLKSIPRPDDAADALAIAMCRARSATSLLRQKDPDVKETV